MGRGAKYLISLNQKQRFMGMFSMIRGRGVNFSYSIFLCPTIIYGQVGKNATYCFSTQNSKYCSLIIYAAAGSS